MVAGGGRWWQVVVGEAACSVFRVAISIVVSALKSSAGPPAVYSQAIRPSGLKTQSAGFVGMCTKWVFRVAIRIAVSELLGRWWQAARTLHATFGFSTSLCVNSQTWFRRRCLLRLRSHLCPRLLTDCFDYTLLARPRAQVFTQSCFAVAMFAASSHLARIFTDSEPVITMVSSVVPIVATK